MNKEPLLKYGNVFCFLHFFVSDIHLPQPEDPLFCMVLLCQECKEAERINVQFFTLETFLEVLFRGSSCGSHSFIMEL